MTTTFIVERVLCKIQRLNCCKYFHDDDRRIMYITLMFFTAAHAHCSISRGHVPVLDTGFPRGRRLGPSEPASSGARDSAARQPGWSNWSPPVTTPVQASSNCHFGDEGLQARGIMYAGFVLCSIIVQRICSSPKVGQLFSATPPYMRMWMGSLPGDGLL